MNDADLCKKNGWRPGTILRGEPPHGDGIDTCEIEITAIGKRYILAFCLIHNSHDEMLWDLQQRVWKPIIKPKPND